MTYAEFVEELKAFCISKGFEIAGTCSSESIYGEITVRRIDATDWDSELKKQWDANKFNFEADHA